MWCSYYELNNSKRTHHRVFLVDGQQCVGEKNHIIISLKIFQEKPTKCQYSDLLMVSKVKQIRVQNEQVILYGGWEEMTWVFQTLILSQIINHQLFLTIIIASFIIKFCDIIKKACTKFSLDLKWFHGHSANFLTFLYVKKL